MPEFLVIEWRSVMLDATARGIVLFLAASAAVLLLRRAPAATRHLVWELTLGSFLILPFLSLLLPVWQIRLPVHALPAPILAGERMPAHLAVTGARPPDLVSQPTLPFRAPRGRSSSGPGPARQSPGAASSRQSVTLSGPAPLPTPSGDFLLWLGGAAVLLARALGGLVQLSRIRRRCRRVTAAPVIALAAQLARDAGLSRPVTLLHGLLDGPPAMPMTWGFRRPVVLLPTGFAAWPEARQRAVLLHELAHVRRGDWLVQLLANLTCALYWFHPLVWWAARSLRSESEQACDDRVLTAGVKASDYAGHLLDVVRAANPSRRLLRSAVSMARGPLIELRLRAILDSRRRRAVLHRRASALAWVMTVCIVLPVAAARLTARTQRVPNRRLPAAERVGSVQRGAASAPRVEICSIRETSGVHGARLLLRAPEPAAPLPAEPAGPRTAAKSPPPPTAPDLAEPPAPAAPAAPPVDGALSFSVKLIEPLRASTEDAVIDIKPVVRTALAFAADEQAGAITFAAERDNEDRADARSAEPNLADKDLSGANLAGRDLSGKDLSGKDLSGANLSGAKLANANLSHTDLSGANLANVDLSHAKMTGTDLSGANLSGARLIDIDLSGVDFSGANLSRVEARGLTLAHADLSGTNLKGIHLAGRDLSGADFSGADLSGARLDGANLNKADLSGANLSDADLSHARLTNADLSGANLNGTKLDGADLAGADVSGTKLDRSKTDQGGS